MYTLINDQDDFLVVDKHPGTSIHDESGTGLIRQLRQDLDCPSIVPVHRLDKATSGLLLCAKTAAAASALSLQFQNRQVEKYYLAISGNKPRKKQGAVIGDMLKARNGSWKLSKSRNNPAVTQFFSYSLGEGLRLFILKPHTGKTHQLRVALKSLGAGILGDQRYASAKPSAESSYQAAGERLHLHAYALYFDYAGQGYRFYSLPAGGAFSETTRLIKAELAEPAALPWPTLRFSPSSQP